MLPVCILGAAGRMGQCLLRAARTCDDIRVAAAIERDDHPALGQDGVELRVGAAVEIRGAEQLVARTQKAK